MLNSLYFSKDYNELEASINGKKVPIYRTNLSFMGLYLPAGNNQIKFRYNADYIKFSAIAPILFLILGLFYFNRKEKNEQKNN
ncbi:MAG: YfhO family protein [Chitinophagaceae bacterium]|nr:YfhO family protein [Chitinophagaceae bacterium]